MGGYLFLTAAVGFRLVMRPLSVPAVSSTMALIKVGLRERRAGDSAGEAEGAEPGAGLPEEFAAGAAAELVRGGIDVLVNGDEALVG